MIRNRDFGGEFGIFYGMYSLIRLIGLVNNFFGIEVIVFEDKFL